VTKINSTLNYYALIICQPLPRDAHHAPYPWSFRFPCCPANGDHHRLWAHEGWSLVRTLLFTLICQPLVAAWSSWCQSHLSLHKTYKNNLQLQELRQYIV